MMERTRDRALWTYSYLSISANARMMGTFETYGRLRFQVVLDRRTDDPTCVCDDG